MEVAGVMEVGVEVQNSELIPMILCLHPDYSSMIGVDLDWIHFITFSQTYPFLSAVKSKAAV